MISAIISRLVILLFGTLYPAYASYKAVRTKNVKEYVKWMMYWIVFALFTCAETITDVFLSFWFPFYYEIKIVLVIWLLSPATKGSSILYRNFVHPALTKREQEIDEYISKAKEQGYHTMLHLGSKGVTYATNVIMQTAIKGGGGIVNHLRRSYSLSDLSVDADLKADLNRNSKHQGDTVDAPDVPRDPRLRTQRKPGGSHVDLYFPEMDVDIRSHTHHPHDLPVSLSQIRSSEDISSGYSSAEPLYGEGHVMPEGNPLMRTSSVGATRARGRGGRATAQSKKAVTNEEEGDDFTADYGWQHALPIASLFPGLLQLDPAAHPPHAFFTPEALQLIFMDSFNRNQGSYNISEINEEDDGLKVNSTENNENIKENESFEDAEQDSFIENFDSIKESKSISNKEESKRTDKKNAFTSEFSLPSVIINTENFVEKPPKTLADVVNEKDETHSLENSNAVTEPNMSAGRMNENIDDVMKLDFKSIPPSVVVDEEKSIETPQKVGDIDNEVFSAELSQGNTANKALEETEQNNECFEDASDAEVVLVIPIDEEVFASPSEKLFDQNEGLKQAGSTESVASSGDQCFEDSLLDVAMLAGDESPCVKDRKGKYNKGRAPLPPDIRMSEETEITATDKIPCEVINEPDILIGTTATREALDSESPSDDTLKVSDTNDDYNGRDRETYNISPAKDRDSVSPSPSQSKKDNSNFSRFLPKTGMTSLFNFWTPKDDKLLANKPGANIHRTLSNKSTRSENTPPITDNDTSTSMEDKDERKTTQKLKIRQMSQSPSSRRRYNFD